MTTYSKLTMCHLSRPEVMAWWTAKPDGWDLWAMASFHPAASRWEHAAGASSPLHYNDYKNAALVRELTQGEG
jgi:hypothetical protein